MSVAHKIETFERRRYPRYEAWKSGFIKLRGKTKLSCLILNVSESGALLQLSSATALPKTFMLVVPDDDLEISCHHVRVDGRNVGVSFANVALDVEA